MVAEAFLAAAQTEITGERFNLGAGNPQTINKLVKLLNSDVEYLPKRPGEPDITFANIKKITDNLNWKTKVSFDDGVKIMSNDIEKWRNAPLWDVKSIENATRAWFKYMDNK